MFGRLLKSVSWQVKADLRRSLKSNPDYSVIISVIYKVTMSHAWQEALRPAALL